MLVKKAAFFAHSFFPSEVLQLTNKCKGNEGAALFTYHFTPTSQIDSNLSKPGELSP